MQVLNRLQPIQKAALTSCSLMALGDVTCQAISCKAARKPLHIDLARASRFGVIGLTLHGPFFFKGFGWLDQQFGKAQTLKLVQDTDGWISYFPAAFSKVTAGVDHSYIAPVIGTQWYTWHNDDTHFRYAVAPARAFVECIDELFALREEGYLKAGAENLFLVANGDEWWDSSMVRMVYDEPARFKLSQLVGNLSLLSVRGSQGIPVGHITAFNASPALQLSFAQAIYEAVEQESFTPFEQVLELQDSYLEQRYGKYGGADDDVADEDEDEEALYTTSAGPAADYEDEEEYEEGEVEEAEEYDEAEEEDEAAEAEAGEAEE